MQADLLWAFLPIVFALLVLALARRSRGQPPRTPTDVTQSAPRSLPEGASGLAVDALSWAPRRDVGRLTLVLVGTYGVRVGLRIIERFWRAGRLDDIGAVFVAE